MHGATLTADRFGNANAAYGFDGIDDYISVPNSGSLQSPNAAVSVTAWAYVNTWDNGWAAICAKSDNPSRAQYRLAFKLDGPFRNQQKTFFLVCECIN